MRRRKASAAVVAAVVMPSVAIGGALPAAGAADEPALPSHPFFGHMTLSKGQTKAVGPATGTLGVSSITITNFNSTSQTAFIFAPVMGGNSCNTSVTGGAEPHLYVIVEPLKTLHLAFPTPLVFPPFKGLTCVAANVTTTLSQSSAVELNFNGFSQ